jgi:hypothetical protein
VCLAIHPERNLYVHKNPPLSKTAKAEGTKALLRLCGITFAYRRPAPLTGRKTLEGRGFVPADHVCEQFGKR